MQPPAPDGTPPVPPTFPVPALPVPPSSPPASADAGQSPAIAAEPTAPELADDGDLIEKEWVSKVKHVVSTTRSDPAEQSKTFAKLKSDYLQKRYGKIVKADI